MFCPECGRYIKWYFSKHKQIKCICGHSVYEFMTMKRKVIYNPFKALYLRATHDRKMIIQNIKLRKKVINLVEKTKFYVDNKTLIQIADKMDTATYLALYNLHDILVDIKERKEIEKSN